MSTNSNHLQHVQREQESVYVCFTNWTNPDDVETFGNENNIFTKPGAYSTYYVKLHRRM